MGFIAASHRTLSFAARLLLVLILGFPLFSTVARPQNVTRPRRAPAPSEPIRSGRLVQTPKADETDRAVAIRFAPVFHQGIGETIGIDYITNFDFDGDMKGDNNWNNALEPGFPHLAWVYFSVCETRTHYFIHYAAFHPRDYKGGVKKGVVLSDILREAAKYGAKYDPTGISDDAVLAHENDMEGCLVVVQKGTGGDPLAQSKVVAVETLSHNRFLKYRPAEMPGRGEKLQLDGTHPVLFVEPRGHGIEAYRNDSRQARNAANGVVKYEYVGVAEDPARRRGTTVGYDLQSLGKLWKIAQGGTSETFGAAFDYGVRDITVTGGTSRKARFGQIGSAFLGKVGGQNMARPPWGWFDSQEREQPLGEWFLNPAATIKRHYNFENSFSVEYAHHPFAGISRTERR